MSTWPPSVEDLKSDASISVDTDDERLTRDLDAAVAYVRRVRPRFNYEADPLSPYPAPTADVFLGTIRLASRWHTRTRSPDGLISMGDLGGARVSSGDIDIDRLLRIGRFAAVVIA